jgi:hypothetical protein
MNELNRRFFFFDEPLKGSKTLKTFKISLTFRFDKLSRLSKSVHVGENSQILTVSNKKYIFSRSGVEINFSDVNIVTEVEHFLPREQIFAP